MIRENFADEDDFDNYLVVKNWKRLNKNKGEKDSIIKDHVARVGKYPTLHAKRAQFLQEKRTLLAE